MSRTALNQTGRKRTRDPDDEPQKIPIDLDDDVPEASFSQGTLIRLANLSKCGHLNGKVCRVLKYVPERQRYQVKLHHAVAGENHKAVQAFNMLSLPAFEEVQILRDDLLHLHTSPSVVKSALARLEALPINKSLIAETKMPKAVKEVEKRFSQTSHTDIVNKSRELIRRWREVWRAGEVCEAGKGASPDVTFDSTAAELGQQVQTTPEDKASLTTPEAAEQFVDVMRKAPINQIRTVALSALAASDNASLNAFVGAGGLAVLDGWIQDRHELRSSCLTLFRQILIGTKVLDDKSRASILSSITSVANSDKDPENQRQARSIIKKWFPNCMPTRMTTKTKGEEADARSLNFTSSSVDVPEHKRQRLAEPSSKGRGTTSDHDSMANKRETGSAASSESKRLDLSSASSSSSSAVASAPAHAQKRLRPHRFVGPILSDIPSSATSSQPVTRIVKAEAAESNGESKLHTATWSAKDPSVASRMGVARKDRTGATTPASLQPIAGAAPSLASWTDPVAAAQLPDPRPAAKALQTTPAPAAPQSQAKPVRSAPSPAAPQLQDPTAAQAKAAKAVSTPPPLAAYRAHAAAIGNDQAVGPAPTRHSIPMDTRATLQTANAQAVRPALQEKLSAAQVTGAASTESHPRTSPATSSTAARRQLPVGLEKLDPRVAHKLQTNPKLLEFLNRHPNVWQNFNTDNVSFLARRLEKSRETSEDLRAQVIDADTSDEDNRSIVFSNLHNKMNDSEIEDMLEDAGVLPRMVSMPRESRRRRSCGMAYAVLSSREDAERVVKALDGKIVLGEPISVTHLVRGKTANAFVPSGGRRRKLTWKEEETLWDVGVYDPNVKIAEMGNSLHKPESKPEAVVFSSAGQDFKAAARRELEAEAKLVRQALNHEDI